MFASWKVFKSDEKSDAEAPWKLNELCLNREPDMTSSKQFMALNNNNDNNNSNNNLGKLTNPPSATSLR